MAGLPTTCAKLWFSSTTTKTWSGETAPGTGIPALWMVGLLTLLLVLALPPPPHPVRLKLTINRRTKRRFGPREPMLASPAPLQGQNLDAAELLDVGCAFGDGQSRPVAYS